ncbi:MAG TPA: hypothetical protein VGE66_03905 [Chitinophagaceae bacterium]
MTKGDKIAFSLIAVLFVLVIVFRKDIAGVFDRDGKDGKEKKKDKKDKDGKDDKKEGRHRPFIPVEKEASTVLYTEWA